MNLIDIIKSRRSIRIYDDQKNIPDKIIQTLLESIRWSPSWANSQCWEIVLIKNNLTKKKLQETLAHKKNPATNAIIQAPIIIAMCAKKNTSGWYNNTSATKFGDWFMYDLGIATQSLCLTAQSLGLGTVIVGLFDHDHAKEIIGIPEEYELTTIIPVGYPAKIGKAPKRRQINDFLHNEYY